MSYLLSILPSDVINKIAAGEIVKELLENSLDANSTSISIIARDGGISALEILDDGIGISKDNIPKLCTRFTTSKISTFNDLQKLTTFGFRGEALSSISYVSRLELISKVSGSPIGYKAFFKDGKFVEGSLKPIASKLGTQFKVEDLFYNAPQRKATLRAPNEEYQKILKLVQLYGICNPSDLVKNYDVLLDSATSTIERLEKIYGELLVKSLIYTKKSFESPKYSFEIYTTSPNFHLKKFEFILFVNGRLVENKTMKKAFCDFYNSLLLKQTFPFIFLQLCVPPSNIDVNVHPTKSEVCLLVILDVLASLISSGSKVKTFPILNPFISTSCSQGQESEIDLPKISSPSRLTRIRSDPASPSILRSFGVERKTTESFCIGSISIRPHVNCELESVHKMISAIQSKSDLHLKLKLKSLVFIGFLTPNCSLFQLENSLYMVNHSYLFNEFFVSFILRNISSLASIQLNPLAQIDMTKISILSDKFIEAREMLNDYFSFSITENGILGGIPIPLHNFPIDFLDINSFTSAILSFAKINWEDEYECILTLTKSIASAFSFMIIPSMLQHELYAENKDRRDSFYLDYLENHIIPLLKEPYFFPSVETNSYLSQLADIKDLYRIFERC